MPIIEVWEKIYYMKDALELSNNDYAYDQTWVNQNIKLWKDVLEIAQQNSFLAHGTLNWLNRGREKSIQTTSNDPQHQWALLNIMLEGQIREGSAVGKLTNKDIVDAFNAARYGPYYVVLKNDQETVQYANRWSIYGVDNQEIKENNIAIYLIPDESMSFFEEGLKQQLT